MKKNIFHNMLVRVSILVFVVFCIVSFIIIRLRQNDYIAEANALRQEIDEISEHMNQLFSLKGATVLDKGDGAAFFFNWDNSGEDGNCDLYFDVEVNGETYTFVVRRYLTAPGGEVYEAVKNLQVGDTVEITGFLYWYEGPQPHITSITVK